MTTITVNPPFTNDQSSGPQTSLTTDTGDDQVISAAYAGLSTEFQTFLTTTLAADTTTNTIPTGDPLAGVDFADDVEAAVSSTTFITVNETDGTNIDSLRFSAPDETPLEGEPVLWDDDDDDTTPLVPLLSIDGDPLYFWSYGDDFVIVTTSDDPTAKGDVVAAFHLIYDATTDTAQIEEVTFTGLLHPDATDHDDTVNWGENLYVTGSGSVEFRVDDLKSGNYLFAALGGTTTNSNGDTIGLVLSAHDPAVKDSPVSQFNKIDSAGGAVNASAAGGTTIGFGTSQNIVAGAWGVGTIVLNQTPGGFKDLDDMNYTGILDVRDFSIFVSQVVSDPTTSFIVYAWTAGDSGSDLVTSNVRNYLDGDLSSGDNLGFDAGESALKDDLPSTIWSVEIYNGDPSAGATPVYTASWETGVLVETGNTTDYSAVRDYMGLGLNAVQVSGISSGDTVRYNVDKSTTSDFETMNRFWIIGEGPDFDIGKFSTSEGVTVKAPVGPDMLVDDDGPDIELAVVASPTPLPLILDESINDPASSVGEANELSGQLAPDFDKIGTLGAPNNSDPIGKVTTSSGVVQNLFTQTTNDPGTDGEKSLTSSYVLTLTAGDGTLVDDLTTGVATTLSVTEDPTDASGSSTIVLFRQSATEIWGMVNLDGGSDYELTALKIYLSNLGDTTNGPNLNVEQIMAIEDTTNTGDDPGAGADGSVHDTRLTLGIANVAEGQEGVAGLAIKRTDTLTDNDDDTDSSPASYNFTADVRLEDDGVVVDVTADATPDTSDLFRNLDETVIDATPPGAGGPFSDTYVADTNPVLVGDQPETESSGPPINGDADDTGVLLPAYETTATVADSDAIGELTTDPGDLETAILGGGSSSSFVDYGSDKAGDLGEGSGRSDVLSFQLDGPTKTNLVATDRDGSPIEDFSVTARTIWLVKISDTLVQGVIRGEAADGAGGADDPTNFDNADNYVIFEMELNDASDPTIATITYRQFAAVENSDPTLYDEEDDLLIAADEGAQDALKLRWTTTAIDGDNDTDSDYDEINLITKSATIAAFDDDGPAISISRSATELTIAFDESINDPGGTVGNAPESADAGQVAADSDKDDITLATPDDTNPIGRITIAAGTIAGLFTRDSADGGTDGQKGDIAEDYILTLTDKDGNLITDTTTTVETTLSVSQDAVNGGDTTIQLIRVSDTQINGVVDLDGTSAEQFEKTALIFKLVDDGTGKLELVVEQIMAIEDSVSGDQTGDGTEADNQETLGIANVAEGQEGVAGLAIKRTDTITDGDADTASSSASYNFTDKVTLEDDGVVVDVTADATPDLSGIFYNLDETVIDGTPPSAGGPFSDHYNPDTDPDTVGAQAETESEGGPINGDADDTGVLLPTWDDTPIGFAGATQAIGAHETAGGALATAFLGGASADSFVDYGSDKAGDLGEGSGRSDVLSFQLDGPIKTTLKATVVAGSPLDLDGFSDAEREIWLVKRSDTVVEAVVRGQSADGTGGADDPDNFDNTDNYVIFRFTLVGADDATTATMVDEQFAPIEHADPDLYDEELDFLLASAADSLRLRWTTTAIDKDDDQESGYDEIDLISNTVTILSIDDDGPDLPNFSFGIIEEDDVRPPDGTSDGNDEDGSIDADARGNTPPGNQILSLDIGAAFTAAFAGIEPDIRAELSSDTTGISAEDFLGPITLKSRGQTVEFEVQEDTTNEKYVLYGFVDGTVDNNTFGDADDREVFRWEVTYDAVATFIDGGQLDHRDDLANGENSLDINLTSLLTFFEADGDRIVVGNIDPDFAEYTIVDDVPYIARTLDETDGGAGVGAQGSDPILGGLIAFTEVGSGDPLDSDQNSLKGLIGTDANIENGLDDATDDIARSGNKQYTFVEATVEAGIMDNGGITGLTAEVSADGTITYYYVNSDAGSTLAYESGVDTLWFTNTLLQDANGGAGAYLFEAKKEAPQSFTLFTFEDLDSGQALFGIVGDPDNALLVLGSNPNIDPITGERDGQDTMNNSQGGYDNQYSLASNSNVFKNPDAGLWLVFLQDVNPDFVAGYDDGIIQGLDSGEYNDADNIVQQVGSSEDFVDAVSSSFVQFTKVVGSTDASVEITLWDIDNTLQGRDLVDALDSNGTSPITPTGTMVDFESVTIYSPVPFSTGQTLDDAAEFKTFYADGSLSEGTLSGVSVTFNTELDVVTVTGIEQGMTVSWQGAGLFDASHVEYLDGQYKTGPAGTFESNAQPDLKLVSQVQIEDFDGDTDVSNSFELIVDGTGIYADGGYDTDPDVV